MKSCLHDINKVKFPFIRFLIALAANYTVHRLVVEWSDRSGYQRQKQPLLILTKKCLNQSRSTDSSI